MVAQVPAETFASDQDSRTDIALSIPKSTLEPSDMAAKISSATPKTIAIDAGSADEIIRIEAGSTRRGALRHPDITFAT